MTAWTRGVMARLGLEINEAKTSVKNARVERFDFLGYTFGPHWRRRDGKEYPGASPSKKSIGRIRDKVSYTLVPFNPGPFFSRVGPEVRDQLNAKLRGWAGYYSYGSRLAAYRPIDRHVAERVRGFLTRRHKVAGRVRPSSPTTQSSEISVLCVSFGPATKTSRGHCREFSRRAGCGKTARPVR
jgi:RNA-directed DNA polymerase